MNALRIRLFGSNGDTPKLKNEKNGRLWSTQPFLMTARFATYVASQSSSMGKLKLNAPTAAKIMKSANSYCLFKANRISIFATMITSFF